MMEGGKGQSLFPGKGWRNGRRSRRRRKMRDETQQTTKCEERRMKEGEGREGQGKGQG